MIDDNFFIIQNNSIDLLRNRNLIFDLRDFIYLKINIDTVYEQKIFPSIFYLF